MFEGFLIEEAEGIVRRELALQATYQPMLEVKVEGDESVRTLVIDVTPTPRADRIEVRFDGVDDKLKKELRRSGGQTGHRPCRRSPLRPNTSARCSPFCIRWDIRRRR